MTFDVSFLIKSLIRMVHPNEQRKIFRRGLSRTYILVKCEFAMRSIEYDTDSSQEKPPQKKSSPKNGSNNANYGGPGSFTPSEDPSLRYHAHRHPSQGMSPSRIPTSSSASPLSTRPRSSTVRPSSSLANLDLYSPPYESGAGSPARYPQSDVDSLTHSMAELGVGGGSHRRGSYPVSNV